MKRTRTIIVEVENEWFEKELATFIFSKWKKEKKWLKKRMVPTSCLLADMPNKKELSLATKELSFEFMRHAYSFKKYSEILDLGGNLERMRPK